MDFNSFNSDICKLLGEDFSYQLEVAFNFAFGRIYYADSVVSKGGSPYIIIEHKKEKKRSEEVLSRMSVYQDYLRIKWGIVFFEESGQIELRYVDDSYHAYETLEELTAAILSKESPLDSEEYLSEIVKIIKKHLKSLHEQDSVDKFMSRLTKEYIKSDSAEVSFTPDVEKAFFEALLGKVSDTSIVRYTSKNTLYQIMDAGTFGMCSLNCMNDSSELDYADKYVKAVRNPIENSIKECNDIFITSTCEKSMSDDLLMWRLYAQNAEGVCLNLEIKEDIKDPNFYLYPISYGKSDKQHSELDMIKAITSWSISGPKFVFKNWKIWKHFFKSHHFKYEKEIRLLYYNNPMSNTASLRWIHDSYTGIASPILIFTANDFPLELRKVIIGPRDMQSFTNTVQLNERVTSTTFKGSVNTPFCEESKIKIYR